VGAADAAGLLDAAEAARGYWLSKEVVLGIGMRDGRKPDEALVGASSLSSQGLYRKGSP
jgi:hypothetical protein